MIKTIYKIFFIWDFEKEEKWLNDMASKGFNLIKPGFLSYDFEQGDPNEYTYRLEMLNNSPNNPKSKEYIAFVEETGAEYLGSMMKWVYFRKKKSQGQFDLFSDIDSRISHLGRMLFLIIAFGLFNTFNFVHLIDTLLTLTLGTILVTGTLVVLFEILLIYGFVILVKKRKKLKKERNLRE